MATNPNFNLVDALGLSGTEFVNRLSVNQRYIPDNAQSDPITGAASGGIIIKDILFNTASADIQGPTNIEITSDNTFGVTGAGSPIVLVPLASLTANKTVVGSSVTDNLFPFFIMDGKKLFLHGDDAAGTAADRFLGLTMIFQRMVDWSFILAEDILA